MYTPKLPRIEAPKGIRIGGLKSGTENYRADPERRTLKYGTEIMQQRHDGQMAGQTMGFDPQLYNFQDWCPVYEIGKLPSGGTIYFASIVDHVELLHEYIVLLNTLYEMTPNDLIEINIDSPGGYISAATQICTAIRECKGKVLTHASGLCASAGSLIWSVGHEVSVGDTANFMWHMSSHSDWGNSLGIRDEAQFQIDYVRDALLCISLQRGFITEEEIAKICDNPNETIWISANAMRQRLNNNMNKDD